MQASIDVCDPSPTLAIDKGHIFSYTPQNTEPTPQATQEPSVQAAAPKSSASQGSKPKLIDVCKALKPIAGEWRELGDFLELPKEELDAIAAVPGTPAPPQCLMKTVKIWLKREDPPPTWDELINILEFVDQNVAEAVKKQYS